MFSGRIKEVVQIGYLPFDVRPLELIARSRDMNALQRLTQDALAQKVQCEAVLLRFFLITLMGAFLHVLFEDRRKVLSVTQQSSLLSYLRAILEMDPNHDLILRELKIKLEASSGECNSAKVTEEVFQDLLKVFTHLGLVNFYCISHGIDLQELPSSSSEMQLQICRSVENDSLSVMSKAGKRNPIERLKKKPYRKSVDQYFQAMEDDFRSSNVMPPGVLSFFLDRLQADLKSGSKFRKNDVIDFLLIFCLDVNRTVFVTNDDDVLSALKTASPPSYALSQTLRS
jgi:hypothetical protein